MVAARRPRCGRMLPGMLAAAPAGYPVMTPLSLSAAISASV
jgi:hypothetical protein